MKPLIFIVSILILNSISEINSTSKEYVEVLSGKKKLTGILHLNKPESPVIYYIQGYTCMSIDGLPELHPYTQMINSLMDEGFSVFQLEKSGYGKFEDQKPCADVGYHEETADFEAGYIHLVNELKYPENKIFIFGHSMGGSIAPMIAAKHKPAGVAIYGTGIRSWSDYMLEITRYQGIWNGRDYEKNGEYLHMLKQYYYRWFYGDEKLEEICKDTTAARIFNDLWNYGGEGTKFLGRDESFFKELNFVNKYGIWKNVKCPVLSVYGGADIETMYPDDMKVIAELVNHYRPNTAKFIAIDQTDHLFAKIGNANDVIRLRKEGEYGKAIFENFNEKIPNEIAKFFKQHLVNQN